MQDFKVAIKELIITYGSNGVKQIFKIIGAVIGIIIGLIVAFKIVVGE